MQRVLFECRECNGNVIECAKEGRFYEHRGVIILLPSYFSIPRCVGCNQDWFSDDLIKRLEIVLDVEYMQHADLIKAIKDFYDHNTKK